MAITLDMVLTCLVSMTELAPLLHKRARSARMVKALSHIVEHRVTLAGTAAVVSKSGNRPARGSTNHNQRMVPLVHSYQGSYTHCPVRRRNLFYQLSLSLARDRFTVISRPLPSQTLVLQTGRPRWLSLRCHSGRNRCSTVYVL